MKRTLFCIVILLLFGLLSAASNPTYDYFNSPSPQTFATAWNYCSEQLAKDSTLVSVKILMAYIAASEANRIAQAVSQRVESLDTANKFQYANLLLTQNRSEDAIRIYDELNAESPGWSCPWRHKGQAFYNLKRYKEAATALTQAIETNREHYDAYIWMARTQYQLKKYKAALANLETALTLSPSAEESPGETISEDSIKTFYRELLTKTNKK